MTITATTSKATFNGNDSATSFPFTFKIIDQSHLVVVHVSSAGVETVKTITTDYTVSLNADQETNPGGTVTYPVSGSPLATGDDLIVYRNISAIQTTDMDQQGQPFLQVESALDWLTMVDQQQQNELNRSIKSALSDDAGINLTLPPASSRAGKYLAFNAGGEVTASSGTGADSALRTDLANTESGNGIDLIAKGIKSIESVAELVIENTDTKTVLVQSYHPGSNTGARIYVWDSTADKADHNGGTIIDPDVPFPTDWTNETQVSTWFTATGVTTGCWILVNGNPGRINLKEWGATSTGKIDKPLQAAYNYMSANRTSPSGRSGFGLGVIYIPKGNYYLSTTITMASSHSFKIIGDGEESTVIHVEDDTLTCFSMTPYVFVEIADIGFTHVAQGAVGTWSNVLFDLNGFGGGRGFKMRNVRTTNFDIVIQHNQTNANEDTMHIMNSIFTDFKTFLYDRNAQSVINKYELVSWHSSNGGNVFDINGHGYTHIDTCNVIIDGTFLTMQDGTADGDHSQFHLTNTKFEYWDGVAKSNTNGTTVILDTHNVNTRLHARFYGCGIAAGTPAAGVYQIQTHTDNCVIEFHGGAFTSAKVQTTAQTTFADQNDSYILFKNMTEAPSTTINRVDGAAGAAHIPVIFEGCSGLSNICITGDDATTGSRSVPPGGYNRNKNSITLGTGRLVSGNTTETHTISTYGQLVYIEKIVILVSSRTSVTSGTIAAYTDAGKTNQIGTTVNITAGTSAIPEAYTITIATNVTTDEGIYIDVTQTASGGSVTGTIICDTVSF